MGVASIIEDLAARINDGPSNPIRSGSPRTPKPAPRLASNRSQIYGAIAFYLDHQAEIDKYLEETEREFETSGIPMAQANPVLWEKIQRARAKMGESRS